MCDSETQLLEYSNGTGDTTPISVYWKYGLYVYI